MVHKNGKNGKTNEKEKNYRFDSLFMDTIQSVYETSKEVQGETGQCTVYRVQWLL